MAERAGIAGLLAALDERDAAGRPVTLWLRDDDATGDSAALRQLLALCADHRLVPVIAAVPDRADSSLIEACGDSLARLAVHGIAHRNNAPPGARKCELDDSVPRTQLLADLAASREKLARLAGARLVPMLVPPWNRIAPALLPHLFAAGFTALSTYGPRADMVPAPGLTRINTHLDLIDWKGTRGSLPADSLFGRLEALVRAADDPALDEPIGILTHHRAHDAGAWHFLETLLATVSRHPGARFLAADRLPPIPAREPAMADAAVGV